MLRRDSAPAKPLRLLARKPAIRRPGLKTLIDDRFRVHHPDASAYVIHANAGYHVRVGWIGENLSYRLRDDEALLVATVTDNAHACSCEDFRRNRRKACRHMLAIRSAFEHVGELPPEAQPDPGDSWATWDDDGSTWGVTDPGLDLDEPGPRPTADEGYAPSPIEAAEWLGFTLAREGEHADPTREIDSMVDLRAYFHGKLDGEIELAMAGPRETDGYPAGYCS